MPAATAKIARAQSAYKKQAAESAPSCGFGFLSLCDKTSGEVLILPMRCHKWACPSCAPLRLAQLQDRARRGHPERHIVLTSAPHPSADFAWSAKWIRKKFALLVTRIRRTYGEFQYMAAVEQHKNGAPHLHVLCRGKYIPHKWLSKAWCHLTGNYIVHIKAVDRTEGSINELTKYLAKTAAALEEAGAPGTPVTTSNGWILDPPERDPAYAERHWEACWAPFCLEDLQEVLALLGRSLVVAPRSTSSYTLDSRAPPSREQIHSAYAECPFMIADLLPLAVDLCADPTETARTFAQRAEYRHARKLERLGIAD